MIPPARADLRRAARKERGGESLRQAAGWFKVPTPLGTYNPDWAVLVEVSGEERLYFVVETKSSLFTDDLRDKKPRRSRVAKRHFKALAVGKNPARYVKATKLDDVLAGATGHA